MFGALEEIFNPAAARARKEFQEQHEHVIPIPSPGDKMLAEGKVVIPRTPKAQPAPAQSPSAPFPAVQPSPEPRVHLETD
jgi:hypothetical protein